MGRHFFTMFDFVQVMTVSIRFRLFPGRIRGRSGPDAVPGCHVGSAGQFPLSGLGAALGCRKNGYLPRHLSLVHLFT